ncbi:MAG: hypothetical protein V8S97_07460 [Oscillospiraceae bacterium]
MRGGRLGESPTVTTPRLTLTPLEERDEAAYNALCLDDARNRWWGYDYRQDLKGELTEDYFLWPGGTSPPGGR